MRNRLLPGLVLAAAVGIGGCSSDPRQGYSMEASFRQDVKSVTVPIWQNVTFQHGLENRLTAALVSELRQRSPYAVTTSDNAQTVLSGTITSAELRPLSTDRKTGLVQELALQVSVDFEWKDGRTGKTLLARRQFTAARTFVPSTGSGERLEVGQEAVAQQLARDIVNELRSGW